MVDDRANKAKTIEGSFTNLADDIRAFEDDIGDTVRAAQDHTKNVYQDLEASRADVEALRARLMQLVPSEIRSRHIPLTPANQQGLGRGLYTSIHQWLRIF